MPLEIEIWPSFTSFKAGESLRLIVQGQDVYQDALPGLRFARHQSTRNAGSRILHTSGAHDAHLRVPWIKR